MKNHELISAVHTVTALATCWKLVRKDGTILGFTDHDSTLVLQDLTYHPLSGFAGSAIAAHSSMATDFTEIEGVLNTELITERDIRAGLYDQAEVWIYRVDTLHSQVEPWVVKRGWLGEIAWVGGRFVAEIRSIRQHFTSIRGSIYSPTCRARLGDSKCKIDLKKWTIENTISHVVSHRSFDVVTPIISAELYSGGLVTFVSGLNQKQSFEVSECTNDTIHLLTTPENQMQPNDHYCLIPSCDKQFISCTNIFNNAVNFRGEPHVPGLGSLLKTNTIYP